MQDLLDLGVAQVHINLVISSLLLPPGAPDPPAAFIRRAAGETVRFDPATVAEWDTEIRGLTDAGIHVIAVILNQVSEGPAEENPLRHPRTDVEGAPFNLGAFNTTNAEGVAAFTGSLAFLAERYSSPSSGRGVIGGYIIGNEVDSHWTWHNLGEAAAEGVIEQYAEELRLAWLAIRTGSAGPGVFVSLTHSWARPNSRQQSRNFSGKALLEGLTSHSRAGGDFGWDVAYHPYPQNLFEPRFWDDRLAMFGYDSPMITFKNVELLPAWLRREENLFAGEPRRVILSEQGFHTPAGPDGEEVQAAAYALAFHRIAATPGIDGFILHRHVDVRGEGGLMLGVRGLRPLDGSAPYGHKKDSWNTFRVSGTPAFEREAAFALAHAGYTSWSEAEPRRGPFPEVAPEWAAFERPGQSMFDLLQTLGDARFEHAMQVSQRVVGLPDGGMAESLLLHPGAPGSPPATATWSLDLPAEPKAKLVFRTFVPTPDAPTGREDGVTFRVHVEGERLFERAVTTNAMEDAAVDLSAFAGRTIGLTLEADGGGNNDHDSAQFLTPTVQEIGD